MGTVRSRRSLSGKASRLEQGTSLAAVDLFCGAGGLSHGLRQAGIRVIAGSDNDPDACATYALNFPEAITLCGDVREEILHERLAEAAVGVDIVVGGPPCQAFSQVRNHSRLIDDPRNSLYREFVRTVAAAGPAAFLMENVPGLAQMGVKEQVIRDLEIDGEYDVRAQLVDAADFGVPQTRKRLLFFGVKRNLGVHPPTLTGTGIVDSVQLVRTAGTRPHYDVVARDDLFTAQLVARLADPRDLTAITAEQALGDLVGLESGSRNECADELPEPSSAYQRLMRQGLMGGILNVSVPRIRTDTAMRLSAIPAGGNYRDLPERLQQRYLTGDKWGPSTGSGRLARAHFYAYRRLHPGVWAWTLNTKGDAVYHYAAPRCLSVREFARLQSFPDRFVFTTDSRRGTLPGRIDGGAAHSRYRQVGNAVPPLLAQAAAEALRDCLLAARAEKASA